MNKLLAFLKLIFKPKRLYALLSYNQKGYFNSVGWWNAFDKKAALGKNDEPIPWVTYSFIDFIKPRLNKSHQIFEYGSGNSTLFYAQYVKQVISVEHDLNWFNKIKDNKANNAELYYEELIPNGNYSKKANNMEAQFDIIIVDGRDRVNCCKYAISALAASGVIVLDDSERPEYQEGRSFLKENGFKELSFSGISPGLFYEKATSVFYKSNNCLDI
ncbi:MAG: FkbM family methyltransferase [Pedobacter sp.]|nr:MAG: FkbM family methyltransferase [Pedobacter sp.]